MFKNIEKALFEVRFLIRNIPEVRKMLYYKTPDALEKETIPTISQITPYTFLSPVIEVNNTPDFDLTNFITIGLVRGEVDDEDNTDGVLRIDILCENNNWELNGGKIRPLHMASLIAEKINNTKVSVSHKIFISSIERLILNKNICGYSLVCGLMEGGGLEDEF